MIYSVQDIPCSNTTKAASSATTRAPFPSTTQSHSPLQANLSKPSTKPTATQANRNTTTQRTRSTRAPFPSTSQSHPPLQASKSTSRSTSKHTTHCKVKGEAKHGNPSYCYAFQYDEDELDNAALDCCWISGSHSPINNSLTGFPLNVKLNEKDMYVAWPIYHIYCFFFQFREIKYSDIGDNFLIPLVTKKEGEIDFSLKIGNTCKTYYYF